MRFITAPGSPDEFRRESPVIYDFTPRAPELLNLEATGPDPLAPTHEREDACPACHEVQISVKPAGSDLPSLVTDVPPCSPAGQFLLHESGRLLGGPEPPGGPSLEESRRRHWNRLP